MEPYVVSAKHFRRTAQCGTAFLAFALCIAAQTAPETPGVSLPGSESAQYVEAGLIAPASITTRQDTAEPAHVPTDVRLRSSEAWRDFGGNILNDQKSVVSFPVRLLTTGNYWKPTIAITAVAATLIALDPHDTPYFRQTSTFHGFNKIASGTNTEVAMLLMPAAFYAWSAHKKDTYGKQTVFLAAESVADVQIMTLGMKWMDRRRRPMDVPASGNFSDTWLDSGKHGASFPSGHAMTAFALADVFTERYRNHRWVPFVSYGLAAGVAFSRLSTQEHYPSDVFVGAALGTLTTHYLVLHHHRER
jgi:membrane-associated phospholipid phosphatase